TPEDGARSLAEFGLPKGVYPAGRLDKDSEGLLLLTDDGPLIERLLKTYPGTIAGIKDSSGDWSNTEAVQRAFGAEGFDVFAGSEVFLLRTLRAGGAGCITATGNVNPAPMVALYNSWQQEGADAQQAQLDATRAIFQQHNMIPAMKTAVARFSGVDSWRTLRPPLTSLTAPQENALADALENHGFQMQGVSA
ncbi:MAG: dihydrodipicolinate synthase family protein, partial [Comamonas sp.]